MPPSPQAPAGWPGAAMARQGYCISSPLRTREHLSASDWDYWYAGLPATEDLQGTDGQILIPRGSVRDGGSGEQRMVPGLVLLKGPGTRRIPVRKAFELLHAAQHL